MDISLLKKLKIKGITPEFIQQMANATGNHYPTKEMCENSNPFKWVDKNGNISETKDTNPITVKLKQGVNY